ncbi:MAG: hypothetical protein GY849_02130 [Deltaproteobacteria bacterium]|nr:hypothetical protein [Deltaproteobacteria bacterium]
MSNQKKKDENIPIIRIYNGLLVIDFNNLAENVLYKIIKKRAYKGYCEHVIREKQKETSLTIKHFSKFDFLRKVFGFRLFYVYFRDYSELFTQKDFIKHALFKF